MKNEKMTYENMRSELEELSVEYPFLHISTIGKSLVGRSIPLIRLGKGKKSVLYVGTHHGMEWITTSLLIRYLKSACYEIKNKGTVLGQDMEELFLHRTVYVVPMLNPDGVELQINGCDMMNPLTQRLYGMSGGDFSKWQANGRGVDLNHNYDAGFNEYKIYEKEHGIAAGRSKFSGEYPCSEPECAALCSFIRSVDISLLIALHTQGSEIYYDYNGKCPENAYSIAKKMERLSGYTLSKPEGSACYGGLKDWFIDEYSRPAFTIECGKGENPLPLSDLDSIYSVLRGVLFLSPAFI